MSARKNPYFGDNHMVTRLWQKSLEEWASNTGQRITRKIEKRDRNIYNTAISEIGATSQMLSVYSGKGTIRIVR